MAEVAKSNRASAFASSTLILRGYGLVLRGLGCVHGCPRRVGGKAGVLLCVPRGLGVFLRARASPHGLCVRPSPPPPPPARPPGPGYVCTCLSPWLFGSVCAPGVCGSLLPRVCVRVSPCVFQMFARLSVGPRALGCVSLSPGRVGVGTRLFSCVSPLGARRQKAVPVPGPTPGPRLRSARAPAARGPGRTRGARAPPPPRTLTRAPPAPGPRPEGRPRSAHLVATQRTPGSSRPARPDATRRESRGREGRRRRRCPGPTPAAHVQHQGNNMAAGRGGARGGGASRPRYAPPSPSLPDRLSPGSTVVSPAPPPGSAAPRVLGCVPAREGTES